MILYRYEKRGLLVLLFFLASLILLPRYFLYSRQDFFIVCDPDTMIPDSFRTELPPDPIELNTADSLSLIKLKGIGPYYAKRILQYRSRLGGYYAVRQLKELNMTYFDVDSNAHLFTADPSLILKKDLDSMSFKEVLRHPYLEYEEVRLIFEAKNKYKHISFHILKENKVLPAHKLKKIKPYFR